MRYPRYYTEHCKETQRTTLFVKEGPFKEPNAVVVWASIIGKVTGKTKAVRYTHRLFDPKRSR